MKKLLSKSLIVLILPVALLALPSLAQARDMRGRLGLGFNNQYVHGLPAISMKIQRSRTYSLGAMFALKSDDTNGGYGAGLKVYRNLFDEPLLHFYTALAFSLVGEKTRSGTTTTDNSGYQTDITLGSEFSFSGLESLGFSIEFGATFHNLYDEFVIQTTGYHIITAAVHFYL